MSQRTGTRRRTWKERALSLILTAALAAGLVPGLTLPASAEHWADAYLDQLVDWGVMRADQTADPDADLTRAEFMAIINRAYGYTEAGPIPFEDVLETDWFYDDISIAYTAGYMAGTSETTASPDDTLTREQAFCILGRNMMMKEVPGESLAFADSRDVSDWARGTIKAASDNYIISGYPDNTLHPQDSITRAQMAALISQSLGNPIQQSGTYDLGGVFGNVTITAPNVTLRNAVISGDLYISGGVGLGGIKLENVDVLGRIIVSGAGESEGGEASVIMRNVTAEEMLVDNMQGKTVTVRADGITDIANTIVRTNAYLEDNNTDDKGLMRIELDGDPGARLTLAGRIKQVVNRTPSSYVQAAKGTVAKITVDEAATNSTIQIDRNTKVAEMNLDVATSVLGEGDIGRLNVNAPGSVVTMLPDDIYVRPGLTASIAGVIMDYQAAEEGSLDPRLLSGYPAAKDISPTGLRADFASNKKGTIHWAVSYVTDGSIGEDDLVSPPSYGSKAIANGTVAAPAGGDEVSAQVGNLVVGGSYYLSALVVDEQNNRSTVKVISFSTPDNTVPAFAQGYPYMSRTTCSVAQVTVMPTKSCKLYYALLPQGAKAPTVNELRAAAVTGNLGYGVRDVTKNTEAVFTVNSQRLEELNSYDLYLWLTDVDGVNSSNVMSLRFTTPDTTPPKFNPEATLSSTPGPTNVPLIVGLDEPGTIYWVAVPRGSVYPLPNNQNNDDNEVDAAGVRTARLDSLYAKIQVMYGRNGTRAGSVRITRANTDTAMNITGLAQETAYDLYYVAVDNAGNYSDEVKKLAINTLDEKPPTVKQYFNRYVGRDNTRDPLVTTDIMLEFSEDIRAASGSERGLLDIWDNVSNPNTATEGRKELYALLSGTIELYQTSTTNRPEPVRLWNGEGEPPAAPWINFNNATVSSRDGHVTVTLPYSETASLSAHQLNSGATYYFQFKNIIDNSNKQNEIVPNPVNYNDMGDNNIPPFTTVFALVHLSVPAVSAERPIIRNPSPDGNGVNVEDRPPYGEAVIDYTFRMIPDATEAVNKDHSYDLQLYTGSNVAFDLYCRIFTTNDDGSTTPVTDENTVRLAGITPVGGGADQNNWFYLGNSGSIVQVIDPPDAGLRGVSVNGNGTMANLLNFPTVSSLKQSYTYDFVITVTSQAGETERGVWTGDVDFEVHVLAGQSPLLLNLASNAFAKRREEYTNLPLTGGGLVSIGDTTSGDKFLSLSKTFSDSRLPKFDDSFPKITAGDSFADVTVTLDRAGTLYYVAAPLGALTTDATLELISGTVGAGETDWSGRRTGSELWNLLPMQGQNRLRDSGIEEIFQYPSPEDVTGEDDAIYKITLSRPNAQWIMAQSSMDSYPHGVLTCGSGVSVPIPLRRLKAETPYIVYFVLKGVSDEPSQVFAYTFVTNESSRPKLQLTDQLNGDVSIDTSRGNVASALKWIVFSHDAGIAKLQELEKDHGKIKVPTSIDPSGEVGWYYALTHTFTYSASTDYGSDYADLDATRTDHTLFDVFADGRMQKTQLSRLVYFPGALGSKRVSSTGPSEYLYTTSESGYIGFADWLARSSETGDASRTYLFLAAGHNIASSEDPDYGWALVDSYCALDDVSVVNSDPPKLQTSDSGVVENNGVSGSVWYDNGSLYADITLLFDKKLYWRASANGDKIEVTGSTRANDTGSSGNPAVGLLSSTTAILTPVDDNSKQMADGGTIGITGGGDTFNITINNMTAGYFNTFFLYSGTFTSATGTNTSNKLSLEVTRTETGRNTTASGTTIIYSLQATVKFGNNQTAVITGTGSDFTPATGSSELPVLSSVKITRNDTTANGDAADAYSFEATLTFSGEVYYYNDTLNTIARARDIVTDFAASNGCNITGSTSSDSKSFTITVTNMKKDTPYTINTQDICSENGRAHASGDITITLKRTTTGGSLVQLPQYYIIVTYNTEAVESLPHTDIPIS